MVIPKNFFYAFCISTLVLVNAILPEEGTRAKTMRNETQRTPKDSPSSPPPSPPSPPPYSPPASAPPMAPERLQDSDPTRSPSSFDPPRQQPKHSESLPKAKSKSTPKSTPAPKPCESCISADEVIHDNQKKFEEEAEKKSGLLNNLTVNSRLAFTNWNFNFSPAIQYQSVFFPTYEMDLSFFGFEFSYMTTLPPQPANLFRDISIIGQENSVRQSVMEYMRLAATPLTFMENPLLKNLLAIEFRKTTKSTIITANQNIYYFPYATYPGLTVQDSDLGIIYYEQKAAGSRLGYTIKERDWLFTVGLYALRIGYFDVNYAKPYQMDADIYQGDTLIDRRVYLFEGQASGYGLMVGLQNLYFPTWETKRFYFTASDTLANGFFWGLKELGFYWGTGTINLQNGIDLVEKYRAFYQNETGHKPSVSFLRQIVHVVIGYKFNRHVRLFVEYRYANYSLALKDSYEDASYNYFLSHAINRDTIQQFAVNLTVGF